MPVLYFIRHGETDWNREGRLQGQTEIPINARGKDQARVAASHLARVVPPHDDGKHLARLPFVASPMVRTRQTTEIIRQTLDLDPKAYRIDPRLREITFGRWEGKTWPEVRLADPQGADHRERDKWGYQPPGGESYQMVRERVGDWLASIQHDTCVIAHGGIARVLMVLAGNIPTHEVVSLDIWQGRLLMFHAGAVRWFPHESDG